MVSQEDLDPHTHLCLGLKNECPDCEDVYDCIILECEEEDAEFFGLCPTCRREEKR